MHDNKAEVNHQSFSPITSNKPKERRTGTSTRKRLNICWLVGSLSVSVLVIIIAIHLELENYRRIIENSVISENLKELTSKTNRQQRASLRYETVASDKTSLHGGSINASDVYTRLFDQTQSITLPSVSERYQTCTCNTTDLYHGHSRSKEKQLLQKLRNNYQQLADESRRYYEARLENVVESVGRIESAQNFLTQQTYQRLTYLETNALNVMQMHDKSIYFMAALVTNHVPKVRGSIMNFQNVLVNKGNSYSKGKFACPLAGLYLFSINLFFQTKPLRSQFNTYQPLNIAFRKNQTIYFQIFKQNKPYFVTESVFDLSLSKTLLIDLNKGDAIDIFVWGSANWHLAGGWNPVFSTFSGILFVAEKE
ncbi:uncharacterized protein LOC143468650 [Clavelina lepadiformis]|uniref:uncharacterized protein LOC143468650 n=1 Tax=Clavelina lepadiformis TaxID=159417 RepID=UPI0040438AD9